MNCCGFWKYAYLNALFGFFFLSLCSGAQGSGFGSSRPLPDGRQFHGSAVLGDYLYVFGGYSRTEVIYTPTVLVSKIDSGTQGGLGPWRKTTPMLQGRGYIDNSTLVHNDIVYVIGGSDDIGDINFDTAIYARPDKNGDLSRWLMSDPFGGGGISAPSAFATPGYLHVTGGALRGGTITKGVWSAPVGPNGALGQWRQGPELPKKLWYHNAAVAGGRAYIWGGLSEYEDKVASPDVFSAEVLSSGLLGTWKKESPLPTPFYGCPTSVAGNFLISFCPRVTGGNTTSDAWFAQVSDNKMSQWKSVSLSVPMGIYHSAASDYRRNTVYVIGGRSQRVSTEILGSVNYFKMAGASGNQRNYNSNHENRNGQSQYSYSAGRSVQSTAPTGFYSIEQARLKATAESAPLVIYFNTKGVKPCVDQNALLQSYEFQQIFSDAVFAWVDVRDYPQMAQQYAIWRVPTWIVFNKDGSINNKHIGQMTAEQLKQQITKAK